jgi:uncharacterized protein (DUF1499 family)
MRAYTCERCPILYKGKTMPAAPGKWTTRIARATMVVALLVLLAGPVTKFGLLPWQAGLGIFALAALLAGIGGLFSVVSLLRRRGGLVAMIAAAAGIAAFAVLMATVVAARAVPPINDITTDPVNPPAFVAITTATRGADAAPLGYDPGFAAQQTAAYPEVRPLLVESPPAEVFPRMLAAAKAMDWEIVSTDQATGRIEATATVPWWGFKDDIVVVMSPNGNGTRVDVRSKSRVGKSDLGVNAARIQEYLGRIGG